MRAVEYVVDGNLESGCIVVESHDCLLTDRPEEQREGNAPSLRQLLR